MLDAQRLADGAQITVARRIACHTDRASDLEVSNAGEIRGDRIANTFGEDRANGIMAEILERKHGDGFVWRRKGQLEKVPPCSDRSGENEEQSQGNGGSSQQGAARG